MARELVVPWSRASTNCRRLVAGGVNLRSPSAAGAERGSTARAVAVHNLDADGRLGIEPVHIREDIGQPLLAKGSAAHRPHRVERPDRELGRADVLAVARDMRGVGAARFAIRRLQVKVHIGRHIEATEGTVGRMVGWGVGVELTRVGFGRYDCSEQALRVSATISSSGAMATARLTVIMVPSGLYLVYRLTRQHGAHRLDGHDLLFGAGHDISVQDDQVGP